MVMCKGSDQMQSISMVLHSNEHETTMQLTSSMFASAELITKERVISKVVRHMKRKYGLDKHENLVVKLNSNSGEDTTENLRSDSVTLNSYNIHSETHRNGDNSRVSNDENVEGSGSTRDESLLSNFFQGRIIKTRVSKTQRNLSQCDQCGKIFKLRSHMLRHRQKHAGIKWPCKLCEKEFESTSGLSNHMRYFHQDLKNKKCDTCGKRYASNYLLAEHVRVHTGERPYVCQLCGQAFRTAGTLSQHTHNHSNERPFVCEVCNATFKRRNQLNRHELTHTGERKFICDICGKTFSTNGELIRHKNIHNDLKPFACPICHTRFNQKRYVKNHLHHKHKMTLAEVELKPKAEPADADEEALALENIIDFNDNN